MKISSEQSFNSLFHWKNEDKLLGDMKYTIFSGKQWTFLGLLQVPGKNALIKSMVHTRFFKKITKNCYIFWEKCKK